LRLTEAEILKLVCPAGSKDRLVADDGQRGLYLRIGDRAVAGKEGGRSFLAQYSLGGKKRRFPIEAATLREARSAAAAIMGDAAKGRDPVGERQATKAEAIRKAAAAPALTLEGLIGKWTALALRDRRASYAHEAVRALRKAFPKHMELPAEALTKDDVQDLVDDMVSAGKPVMARQVGRYGAAAFSWAWKRNMVSGSPFVRLDTPAAKTRDRVLSDEELRAIWQATAEPGGFNSVVRLLMLTGQRLNEVAGMAWEELSADLTTWELPGERSKNGKAHVIPLSPQARAVIEAAPRYANRLCFPGRDGVMNSWGRMKDRLDEASGVEGWTLHDLRRTLATNLQKIGVRLEVTEAALNHVSGSRAGIVGVYQRHSWADEKRAALEAWAARLDAIVAGVEPASNVTKLRA
jgi:integrase